MNIVQSLRPVYREDDSEWQDLINDTKDRVPSLFWYGGAALDIEPITALFNGLFPKNAQELISKDIFPILTDYDSKILMTMKYIYENFDQEDFSYENLPNKNWFNGQLHKFEILQMIPLTLFDSNTVLRIRNEYPNFHSYMTSSVIPDDKWHFIFIQAEVQGKEYNFLYGFIENLTFWKEVVERFSLNIEAFCALRVGGKSGSWEHTHSPATGKLFNSIRTSKENKPKLWIADDCLELREIWREINPHEKGFYGVMHFFETTWNEKFKMI